MLRGFFIAAVTDCIKRRINCKGILFRVEGRKLLLLLPDRIKSALCAFVSFKYLAGKYLYPHLSGELKPKLKRKVPKTMAFGTFDL